MSAACCISASAGLAGSARVKSPPTSALVVGVSACGAHVGVLIILLSRHAQTLPCASLGAHIKGLDPVCCRSLRA